MRVYRNVRATGLPVYVAAECAAFADALARGWTRRVLLDRWPVRGPASRALVGLRARSRTSACFAVAGDEPRVGAEVFAALDGAHGSRRLEAAVPEHDGRIEPLAALYVATAFVREAHAALARGDEAMHALVERLRTRVRPVRDERTSPTSTPPPIARRAVASEARVSYERSIAAFARAKRRHPRRRQLAGPRVQSRRRLAGLHEERLRRVCCTTSTTTSTSITCSRGGR